jgi:hypothetical protein
MSDDHTPPATVSLSRSLGFETPRHLSSNRDARGTETETTDLKALALRVLVRDKLRDSNRGEVTRNVQSTDLAAVAVEAWDPIQYPISRPATRSPAEARSYATPLIAPARWASGFASTNEIPFEMPCPERRGLVERRDGAFLHFCVECGRWGSYGYGCSSDSPGRWYCREHRPNE